MNFNPADHCFLDAHAREGRTVPWEPLGFCGWEILVPPDLVPTISSLTPQDCAGRNLFVASWDDVYVHHGRRWPRAWPTVPLLVRANHRSLRLLFQCTNQEALLIGQRLAIRCQSGMEAGLLRECAPALLLELVGQYLDADPLTRALHGPDWDGRPDAMLAPWVVSWEPQRILVQSDGEPLDLASMTFLRGDVRQAAVAPLSQGPDTMQAIVQAYAMGRPTMLVPLSLYYDFSRVPDERLKALDSSVIRDALRDSAFTSLPMRVCGANIEMLLALRADNWSQHLLHIREEAGKRLKTPMGYSYVLQEAVLDMFRPLLPALHTYIGADQINPPPPPGPRQRPTASALGGLHKALQQILEVALDPAAFISGRGEEIYSGSAAPMS